MNKLRIFFLFIFIAIITIAGFCQTDLEKMFAEKGEVYFKFEIPQTCPLEKLTHIISIDNVNPENSITAYASKKEYEQFLKLNLDHELLPHPGDLIVPVMKDKINLKEIKDWDFYPTYEAYVALMYQFEENYPDLCDVFSIGTSIDGRQLLFAKISNNVSTDEGEARVMYTSSIHGDETTGYVLMLHLIDYLLSNYNSIDKVTNMMNNLEIWINPLANPDGTYAGGNSSVYGSTRYNANNIDINRNFPDPEDGEHPDGNAWQTETMEFMELADSVSFVLSANFHGGAEVFNYPWDTWPQLNADDGWWQYVGHEWADTAQFYSPVGYMDSDEFDDGISNGYAWYTISGGRQDYMNYFHHCREVTLEISNIKLLPASQLPDYWEYNYRSFLNYLEQALFGVQGTITDSISGNPIKATVYIEDHDMDNSWVDSDEVSGNYFRPLYQGAYDITFWTPGYQSKTIGQVNVINKQLTTLDVKLVYTGSGIHSINTSGFFNIGPNPNNGTVYMNYLGKPNINCEIQVLNSTGEIVKHLQHVFSPGSGALVLEIENQAVGIYFVQIISDSLILSEKIILN